MSDERRLFIPPDMYRIFENSNHKNIIAYTPWDENDSESNIICLGCGNRGIKYPFKVLAKINTRVTIDNGRVVISPDKQEMREAVNSVAGGSQYFGEGKSFMISNRTMAICMNCGGPVVGYLAAVENCVASGCGGCIVCGDFLPRDKVLARCIECFNLHPDCFLTSDLTVDFENFNLCDTSACGNNYARNCYSINIDEIVELAQQRGN